MKPPTLKTLKCPRPKCPGVLFTAPASRMHEAMGVTMRQCDKCGDRWAVRPEVLKVPD